MTSRARALSALGAYLCLSAQLLGLMHVLLVRHATCPGHGEVTHGIEPSASHVDQPLVVTVRGGGPIIEHRDEHCLLFVARRRDLAGLVTERPDALAPLPPVPGPAVVAATALVPTLAVLRLAPKTSPPVA
jgi:hypothetical protein